MKQNYNNELLKTKNLINNLKTNMDVSYYELELLKIQEFDLSITSNQPFSALIKKQFDYQNAIKKLKRLQKELINYETLYNIKNSCLYLQAFLSKDITKEKINKSADEIITSLNIINSIDKSVISNTPDIEELLIKGSYNIIKYEMIYNNHSNTLDYILNKQIYINEINTLILNETNELINSINYLYGIENLKDLMKNNALSVNEETFKKLVLSSKTSKIKELILSSLTNLKDDLEKNLDEVNSLYKTRYGLEKDLKRLLEEKLKPLKKILNKKIISLVLSTLLAGKFSYFYYDAYKKQCTTELYLTNSYTITKEGLSSNENEYLSKLENEYQIILELSNVVRNDIGRNYLANEKYDVTNVLTKEEVLECPNINIENLNLKKLETRQQKC